MPFAAIDHEANYVETAWLKLLKYYVNIYYNLYQDIANNWPIPLHSKSFAYAVG